MEKLNVLSDILDMFQLFGTEIENLFNKRIKEF
jgi:hypothetical protein